MPSTFPTPPCTALLRCASPPFPSPCILPHFRCKDSKKTASPHHPPRLSSPAPTTFLSSSPSMPSPPCPFFFSFPSMPGPSNPVFLPSLLPPPSPNPPISPGKTANPTTQNRQSRPTIPLKSFNNPIEIVQQFQWFRSTIPMPSFPETAAFAPTPRQTTSPNPSPPNLLPTQLPHHSRRSAPPFPSFRPSVPVPSAPPLCHPLSRLRFRRLRYLRSPHHQIPQTPCPNPSSFVKIYE